jgi:DNA-binding NarL/FixJ family response regulator
MARPRVMVVDDHELFRGGLVGLLDEHRIEVVAEVALGADALAAVADCRPNVVLMDLSLPDMSGIEATRRLTIEAPSVRVVVFSVMADERHVIDALAAGACGYVLKDSPIDQIVAAIHAALRGEAVLSPRIAPRLVRRLRAPARQQFPPAVPGRTGREMEVIDLVARGVDNQQIARTLFLSEHTVKNHVSSILVKFGVDNRLQAAVRAVRAGLV